MVPAIVVCVSFFVFLASGAVFRNKDVLLTPSGSYASELNEFRLPFESLYMWQIELSDGSFTDAVFLPGKGDRIISDFSSSMCGRGQFMAAVSLQASSSLGSIEISSTQTCPGVFRVEVDVTLECDELIIGSGVIFVLMGKVTCRRFVLANGAMLQGTGILETLTGTIDGDVVPGFLFQPALSLTLKTCFDCAASVIDDDGLSYDGVAPFNNVLSIMSSSLVVQGSIWINFDIGNLSNTNVVRFSSVQFVNASLILMQANGTVAQGPLACISVDQIITPTRLNIQTNVQNNVLQYQLSSPFVDYCLSNLGSFFPCAGTTSKPVCRNCDVPMPPAASPVCTTYSPGSLGVILGAGNKPGCSEALSLNDVSTVFTNASMSTSLAPDGARNQLTVILATVLPGIALVVIGTVLGVWLFRRHEEAKVKAIVLRHNANL